METYEQVNDNLEKDIKRSYWEIAFGLQKVDNLTPSKYIRELAEEHIKGKKTYCDVKEATTDYYKNPARDAGEREADEVSEAIYEILADSAFRFDVLTFKNYHFRLFRNLDPEVYHPGEFRTINITKKEPILNGKSVQYQDFGMLKASLEYDFNEEAGTNYLSLSQREKVEHLASFTSRIWQVHPFYEGNTRTTAVFIEKYLRSLGYKVDNEIFKDRAREFRDALVLANYSNIPDGIQADPSKLNAFFSEMLDE